MFLRVFYALLLSTLHLLAGCVEPEREGSDDPQDLDRLSEEPLQGDSCDLETILRDLEFRRPSWQTIDCLATSTPHHSYPEFATRLLAGSTSFGVRSGLVPLHLNLWKEVRTTQPVTISSANMASMPPWADESGQSLSYPLTSKWHDESLRGAIPAMLQEKREGLPVLLQNHYPVNMLGPEFQSSEEFRNWVQSHFIPEKEREAKAAERVGVESYAPFPIEVEVYFNPVNQPQLNALPTNEIVALAQEWVNATRDAVRPFYSGQLIAHSYAKYEVRGEEWEALSFRGFDEVAFSLFPECDLNTTRAYLGVQLSAYVRIAARDGVPWSLGELGISKDRFDLCGTDFEGVEAELYRTVFQSVDERTPPPVGMSVSWLPEDSESAGEVIRSYFQNHTS